MHMNEADNATSRRCESLTPLTVLPVELALLMLTTQRDMHVYDDLSTSQFRGCKPSCVLHSDQKQPDCNPWSWPCTVRAHAALLTVNSRHAHAS